MKKSCKILRSALFIILAVAMLFCVTACKEKEAADPNLPEGYVPTVEGKLKVTCRADVYPTETAQSGVRNWISSFRAKNPNVDIQVDFQTSDYAAQISSKSIGDVYWLDDGSVYQYAVTSKALMPLDSYVEALNIDLEDVYSGILDLGVVNGKLYFAGMSCGQQTFIYDLGALESAGLMQPGEKVANDWTWEDFKRYAEALTQLDEDGVSYKQVAAVMPLYWSPYFSPFFVAYGGEWCDTVNKKITLKSDEKVVQGISEVINAIDNYWIYPQGVTLGTERAQRLSKISDTQGSVFVYNQAYTTLYQKGLQLDSNGKKWDIAPFPLFPEAASPCGTIGFGVFSYTGNKDAAAALVLSLYTKDGQMAIHGQTGGDVPLLKELGEDTFWHLTEPGLGR